SRFADQPVVVYQTVGGETLVALQLQPKLDAVPGRGRDIVVLVDTSASKVGGFLTTARQVLEALAGKLGADDRVSVRIVNTRPKDVSGGFKSPKGLDATFKALADEYPSGAANLKQAITDAAGSFPDQQGRQRVLVLLGDGKSIANPIDGADRARLSGD